jgi:hypothetical protein
MFQIWAAEPRPADRVKPEFAAMNRSASCMIAALFLVSCLVVPAGARMAEPGGGGENPGGVDSRSGGAGVLAWSQRIIRIGPGKTFDHWRCSVNINGTVYYSTAVTEGGARAKLATYTGKRPYCRREREVFFGITLGL